MWTDFLFFVALALGAGSIGLFFAIRADTVVRLLAVASCRFYLDRDEYPWQIRLFDATPFGYLQKKLLTGMPTREFLREASKKPEAFPRMLWYVRGLGLAFLGFAAVFLLGAALALT